MTQPNELRFLFATSESDQRSIYKHKTTGKFFERRYGLPFIEIADEWAKSQAWFEANRRGKFLHLRVWDDKEFPHIPRLENEEAQNFIVSLMLN